MWEVLDNRRNKASSEGGKTCFHDWIKRVCEGVILIRIGICDPNAEYIAFLTRLLGQIRAVKNADIITYVDPEWLISDVALHEQAFDILIINRSLGRHSGVSIAKEILRLNPFCQLILVTNDNRVDNNDYEAGHAFFLPKDLVPTRLVTVIEQAARIIEQRHEQYLQVTANRERLLLPCSEVFYLERILRKTAIVLAAETVETYQSPQELLETVDNNCFVQCHRSFYVNMNKIFRIGQSNLHLVNREEIPIGSTFAQTMTAAYDSYCRRLLSPERRELIYL